MTAQKDSTVKIIIAVISTMVGTLAVVGTFMLFQTKADARIQDTEQREAWAAIHANAVAIGVLDERTRGQ